MPCRQTYEVNKHELNKAAQRDQSYRNCLATLLFFFFICAIIILVCVFWKSQGGYNDKHESQSHHGEHMNGSTTTTTAAAPAIIKNTTTIKNTVMEGITDVDIESTTVFLRKDKEPDTHEGYKDERTQSEIVTSTKSTFEADEEDSTKVDLKHDNRKEDEITIVDKNILVTSPTDEVTSTSPSEPVAMTNSTEKYVAGVKGVIRNITTSILSTPLAQPVATEKYSSDEYFSSEKSESSMSTDNTATSPDLAEDKTTVSISGFTVSKTDVATDNVASSTSPTSTLPTPLTQPVATDLVEGETTVSISGFTVSKTDVATDNVVSSTSPTSTLSTPLAQPVATDKYSSSEYFSSEKSDMSTDNIETVTREISKADAAISTMNPSINSEETTNTEYAFDNHSQSVASIIYNTIKTTVPTQFDSEKNESTEYTTEKQEEESTTIGYDETSNNNDDVTRQNSSVTEDYTLSPNTEDLPTTTEHMKDPEDITNVTASARIQNETEWYESATSITTEQSPTYNSVSYASNMSGIIITSSTNHIDTTTITPPLPDEEKEVCRTEYCNRTASKMLSYMNHLVHPCDDFYEYACGGFEANPQLIDGDLIRQTKNYQRIAKQMAMEKRENVNSTFATYYDSCVQYERTVNFNERVKMAIDALEDVGKFYINTTWFNNYTDFTNLFSQLMLHHSALLFDVVPKFDKNCPTNFTLQISPPKYESPFMTGHADDLCLEDEFETEQKYMDLKALYDKYKKCNKNRKEFLRSIQEALTVFSVFRGLNNSDLTWNLQTQYIEKTVNDIDSVIMQGYFSHFPSKDEMQEHYAMNHYKKDSLEDLQSMSMFINWTRLIRSLIGENVMETNSIHIANNLHIYLHKEIMSGLNELEEFAKKDPMSLNNAIMALYAHKLYRELVLSKRNDVKDHCLQVATNILRLEASSLYILSFPDKEIRKMEKLIQDSFNDLKQTLENKTKQIEWVNENGRDSLLEKIDNLNLSLPDLSYYKDRDSLYSDYNMSQIMLDNNYFNNSMILLKRHRTLMYAILKGQTNQDRQIWAHYATPFQSKAEMIYDMDVVVIPYGIIDWSSINQDPTLKYVVLATLGNLIAHQIAHHFDSNVLSSWESSKNVEYEGDDSDYSSDTTNVRDYINCHKFDQTPMNFTVLSTEQTVSVTIPHLTLNKRLSDIVGFRLAYDTLALTRSKAEKQLPWIELSIEKLFYLAYAQMYCTKSPLTSSYVSLYESEDLPSRIRVFVSMSSNVFVAETWDCRAGSQYAPNPVCSVFPYIDSKETTQTLM